MLPILIWLFQHCDKIAETEHKGFDLGAETLFDGCRFVGPEWVYCHFLSVCAAKMNTHFYFFSRQCFQIGFPSLFKCKDCRDWIGRPVIPAV